VGDPAARLGVRALRLGEQRLLEDEPPVLLDLRPQLGVIEKDSAVGQQPLPGLLLVQLKGQDAQVELMLLLLARKLADEDVVLVSA
jgi:hypothetical protein